MFSKFLEGLSLVLGMCIVMHALLTDDRHQTAARSARPVKLARYRAPKGRQMAYMAFGSSLLIYGVAEIVLRGM